MKSALIFLLGSFAGSYTFAATAQTNHTCMDGYNYSVYGGGGSISDGSAVDMLTADLRKYVVGFCNSFYGYSYRKRSDFTPDPDAIRVTDSKYVRNMYNDWNQRYMTPNNPVKPLEFVDGVYFAIDPIVSREFGKKEWILFRADLPQTMTALNVAYMMYQPDGLRFIPAPIQEKMKQLGCDEKKYDYLFRKNRSKACREIAVSVLKKLNVDAIQYSWRSADFTSCRQRQRFAYILIRPEIIKSTAIFSFQSVEPTLTDESRFLLALYGAAQKNQSPFVLDWSTKGDETVSQVVNGPDMQLWPNAGGLTPFSDAETATWVKSHLLGCQ